MKKENLPLIIVIISIILIGLNFIFTSDEMDLGFWLRVISSGLLILAMFIIIRERKNDRSDWKKRTEKLREFLGKWVDWRKPKLQKEQNWPSLRFELFTQTLTEKQNEKADQKQL